MLNKMKFKKSSSQELINFARDLNSILPSIINEFSRRQSNELYRGKITMQQFATLCFLNSQGYSSMGEISSYLKVSMPAATGVVTRLCRNGFCRRNMDKLDRRVIRISITQKGVKLVNRINSQREKMIIHIFGKISKKERKQYLKILTRINEILKSGF